MLSRIRTTRDTLMEVTSPQRRFVLLDRDGTINVERHYLSDPDQVELLAGALSGLARMNALGLGLAVVTNQSGVIRGLFDRDRLEEIHQRLKNLLATGGVTLDGLFACPHHPDDGCPCRKPKPGLVLQAAAELDFSPAEAFVIGDKECDLELGHRVGAFTILVTTGYGRTLVDSRTDLRPHAVASDLEQAAAIIERHLVRASVVGVC